ncbi:MAG: hypothetical protein ACTHO8_10910 [Solirubrobacterales bacterium]
MIDFDEVFLATELNDSFIDAGFVLFPPPAFLVDGLLYAGGMENHVDPPEGTEVSLDRGRGDSRPGSIEDPRTLAGGLERNDSISIPGFRICENGDRVAVAAIQLEGGGDRFRGKRSGLRRSDHAQQHDQDKAEDPPRSHCGDHMHGSGSRADSRNLIR